MCSCGGDLVDCPCCGDWCCVYCGCLNANVALEDADAALEDDDDA